MKCCRNPLAAHGPIPVVFLRLSLAVLLSLSFTHLPAQENSLTNRGRTKSIAGKPIGFYLNHKAIDSNSKLFYEGKWSVSDNDRTFAMLDSVTTHNAETRPFYFYLLNQIMKISDGALSEYVSVVCTRYFGQYPCEFLAVKGDAVYDVNIQKWTEFIAFDLYLPDAFRKYAAALETDACRGQAVTSFLDNIGQIIAEENAH